MDAGELQRALALGNLHFSLAVVAHMIRCGNTILSAARFLVYQKVAVQGYYHRYTGVAVYKQAKILTISEASRLKQSTTVAARRQEVPWAL